MKYSKSWTQALQEVRSHNQETEVPEGLSKEGAAEFMAAASAAKKAGKKKFKFGDKEYPVTIKTDIPTEGVKEQVGVRKVDFVDGITPNLDEKMFSGKGEFEVKYASSKKGPIKVSKFNTLEDAKKFLAQVKKEGMNGIISKGGKPVKEELDDKDEPTVQKVVKMLKKASKAHAGQADDLEKSMKEHHEKDANGEPIPHDDEEGLQEHCGECGAMDHVDEKFKKGKYTVRDGNTGKVIATYSSGEKASKEMHKLLDSGKYTDLEVKMEEVEIDEKWMVEKSSLVNKQRKIMKIDELLRGKS